jgi:alpha-1,3-rhamnosyl/mannosyltransferase
MRLHSRRAAAVVTDSQFSADELAACLGMDRERLHVVPLGLSASFRRPPCGPDAARLAAYGLPARYVLYPGGVEPRKNLERLLGGYDRFRRSVTDAPALVLTGARDRYAPIGPTVRRLDLGDSLRFSGRVADEDMPHVYAGAAAVIYPSLYEGFGLPLLEAMAAEVPVACSNRSSLPEIGGDAAWYFDPESDEAIAAGLEKVVADEGLRARLLAAGRSRVARYSIRASADRLAVILNRVLGLS